MTDYFQKGGEHLKKLFLFFSFSRFLKKLIFVSSIKANSQEHNYGKTKLEAENQLIKLFKGSSKTELIIIRPGLVYGNSPKGNLKLIKKFLQYRFSPILSITKNKISMIHVEDLIQLIILVSTKDSNKTIIEAHDGNVYSTHDIFENIYKEIHKKNFIFKLNINIFENFPFFKLRLKKLFSDSKFETNHLKQIGFKCKKNLYIYD